MDDATSPPDRPTPEGATGRPAVRIRPASDAHWRACGMLLPQLFSVARDVRPVVALDGGAGRVIAAAAVAWDAALAVEGARPLSVQVATPFRRQGVGRALVRALATDAARARASGLYFLRWFDGTSQDLAALQAMGFVPWKHRYQYEGRITDGLPLLSNLVAGLAERAWIPKGAKVIPLREADRLAVADLHLRCLGGNREDLLRSLAGGPPGHFDDGSYILVLDGRVVGLSLGRLDRAERLCEIDSVAIDPALRNGWANLWLRQQAAVRLLAGGIERVRYRAMDQHTDTRRAFRRGKTKLVATEVLLRHAIG